MIKNAYPLPLVLDIMNKIVGGKAKYFTKLDVHWGYNNVHIKEGDRWKAAFQQTKDYMNFWSCSLDSPTA